MRYYLGNAIKRGWNVTKSSILSKRIMLGVIGWDYVGRSWVNFNWDIPKKDRQYGYIATNEHGERILIGKTMQEAEEFCFRKYKEFYDNNPQEQDWLPDPYNRKKAVSKIVIVQTE
jgi:hypothetical protein